MPLELAPEELQVYEETFRSALESLKKEVRDETQSKAVKSVRKRHQNSRKRNMPKTKSAPGKFPRVAKVKKVGKPST
jgi:histidinol dehydrogenase